MEKEDLEGTVVSAYDNFSKPGSSHEKQAPADSVVAVLKDSVSRNEKLAPAGSDVAIEGMGERIMEKTDLKGTEVRAYDNFSKPDPSHEKQVPADSGVLEGLERVHVAEKVAPEINPSDNIVRKEPPMKK